MKEKHPCKLQLHGNKVRLEIFGSKNGGVSSLDCCMTRIYVTCTRHVVLLRVVRLSRLRCDGRMTGIDGILVVQSPTKLSLSRLRRRWTDLGEAGYEDGRCVELSQDRVQWRAWIIAFTVSVIECKTPRPLHVLILEP
jgi:hypothetical protein